jgi:hypothetical protein
MDSRLGGIVDFPVLPVISSVDIQQLVCEITHLKWYLRENVARQEGHLYGRIAPACSCVPVASISSIGGSKV